MCTMCKCSEQSQRVSACAFINVRVFVRCIVLLHQECRNVLYIMYFDEQYTFIYKNLFVYLSISLCECLSPSFSLSVCVIVFVPPFLISLCLTFYFTFMPYISVYFFDVFVEATIVALNNLWTFFLSIIVCFCCFAPSSSSSSTAVASPFHAIVIIYTLVSVFHSYLHSAVDLFCQRNHDKPNKNI